MNEIKLRNNLIDRKVFCDKFSERENIPNEVFNAMAKSYLEEIIVLVKKGKQRKSYYEKSKSQKTLPP